MGKYVSERHFDGGDQIMQFFASLVDCHDPGRTSVVCTCTVQNCLAHQIRISAVKPFEIIISKIPMHKRSSAPYVKSMWANMR